MYIDVYIHIHIVITKTIAVNQQMETTTTGGDVWYVYRLELQTIDSDCKSTN